MPRDLVQRATLDPASLSATEVRELHHAVGTAAARRLLGEAPRSGRSSGLIVQAKLTVGPVGDRYEREADRMAADVVRRLAGTAAPPAQADRQEIAGTVVTGTAQRAMPAPSRLPGSGTEGGTLDSSVESSIRSAKGGGRPLDNPLRSSLEQNVGADLGSVRVHTGGKADTLSRDLNARAFTTGSDIFFQKGEYNPSSSEGQRLIAHETTHVVQQTGGTARRRAAVSRSPESLIQRQFTFDSSWAEAEGASEEQARLNQQLAQLEARMMQEARQSSRIPSLRVVRDIITQLKDEPVSYAGRGTAGATLRLAGQMLDGSSRTLGPEGETRPRISQPSLLTGRYPRGVSGLGAFGLPGPVFGQLPSSGIFGRFGGVGGFGSLGVSPSVSAPVGQEQAPTSPPPSAKEFSKNESKWLIKLPSGDKTALSFETDSINPFSGAPLKLENFALHLFDQVYPIPAEMTAQWNWTDGLSLQGHLTKAISVGTETANLTIKSLSATYQKHQLEVDGHVEVKLPIAEPFKVPLTYGESGLRMVADQVKLNLPPLAGVKIDGQFDDLGYDSATGGFGGRGHMEAVFPFLGKTEADLVMAKNAIERASLKFEQEIAYPTASPLIVGQVGGGLIFEGTNFKEGTLNTNLSFKLPDDTERDKRDRQGKLAVEARLAYADERPQFELDATLATQMKVNHYLQLDRFDLSIRKGKIEKGQGAFTLVNVKEQRRTLPIELGPREVKPAAEPEPVQVGTPKPLTGGDPGPQPPGSMASSNLDPDLWGTWDWGWDWHSGFYLRGEVNAPLFPGANGTLTGIATYDKKSLREGGQLDARVEMGDATWFPKYTAIKRPLLKLDRTVPLYRFGTLGGLFAEAKGSLDFQFDIGPIKIDAGGTLQNIDLMTLRPEGGVLDKLVLEGRLHATLEAGPHFTLGAWVLSESLLTVRGGIKAPIAACVATEDMVEFTSVPIRGGMPSPPEGAKLRLPLVFAIDAGFTPYGNVTAFGGMIDHDFGAKPLQLSLLKPRRLIDLQYSYGDLLRQPDLSLLITSDLFKAPSAGGKAPDPECDTEIVTGPREVPTVTGDVSPAGEDLPLDMDLLSVLADNLLDKRTVDLFTKLVQVLGTVAETLGRGYQQVVALLQEWGVIDALRSAQEKLEEFVGHLAEASGYTDLVTAVFAVFKLGPEAEKASPTQEEGEVEAAQDSLASERVRTRRFVFTLANSKAKISANVQARPGETITAAKQDIHKNSLEEKGFDVKRLTVTLDQSDNIAAGVVEAEQTLDSLGKLTQLRLEIDKQHRILNRFDSAKLDAGAGLQSVVGTVPDEVSGILHSTQFQLWKVELKEMVVPETPDPVGGGKMQAKQPTRLAMERRHDAWMVTSRDFEFKGIHLTYEIKELNAENLEKLTLHGKGVARVDWLGTAEGELRVIEGDFKQLDLKVSGNERTIPLGLFKLAVKPEGSMVIDRAGPRDAKLDATVKLFSSAINDGQEPITLVPDNPKQPMVAFNEQWRVSVNAKMLEKSASLLWKWADVNKFAFHRDPDEGVSGRGDVVLNLPGQEGKALLHYETPNFVMKLDGATGSEHFKVSALDAQYSGRAWKFRAGAVIKAIKGFDSIEAELSYRDRQLGLDVRALKSSLSEKLPFTLGFTRLGYHLDKGTFSGEGYAGLVLPVVGDAKANFIVEDEELQHFGFAVEKKIAVPTDEPQFTGFVAGRINYAKDQLSGEIAGDLETTPSLLPKGKNDGKAQNQSGSEPDYGFRFGLAVDNSGFHGGVVQRGQVNLFGLLELSGLNLKMQTQTDVRSTAAKLDAAMGGKAGRPKNLKDFTTKLDEQGIAVQKHIGFQGGALLKVNAGPKLKGQLALRYANGHFLRSVGRLETATGDLKKKDGAGISAAVDVSYASHEGFSILGGELTANLAPGLQAKGALEQQRGTDIAQGLNATLGMGGVLVEKTPFNKDIIAPIEREFLLAAIPTPLGPVVATANAGVELRFEYFYGPVRLNDASVQMSGIDLKQMNFRKAMTALDIEAELGASLLGGPKLGLTAAYLHPKVFAVNGTLGLALKGEAKSTPHLKVNAAYERTPDGKAILPKAGASLAAPLTFGLQANVIPTIGISAAYGILEKKWPISEFGPLDILSPRKFLSVPLNLGNMLPPKQEELQSAAPDSADEMAPAKPEASVTQEFQSPVRQPAANVKVEASPEEGGSETEGPFSFASIMSRLKTSFKEHVGAPVEKRLKDITRIGKKIVELGGNALKNVKETGFKAIKGISLWVKEKWGGDTEEAREKVEEANSLEEVPEGKSLAGYWTELTPVQRSLIATAGLALAGLAGFALYSWLGGKGGGAVV